MPNNRSKAFTLIELLLVLSLVSALLVTVTHYYQTKKFEVAVNSLQHNVEQLGQSLNLYYYLNCANPPTTDISQAELIKAGVLPENSLVEVPWVMSYTLQIRPAADKGYRLWVIARLDQSSELIQYLKGRLQAIAAPGGDGQAIAWMRLPSQKVASMDSPNWIMAAGLQEFNKHFREGGSSSPCAD